MINLAIFKKEDLDSFTSKDSFEDLNRDMLKAQQNPAIKIVSMLRDDKAIAFAGLSEHRVGAGELWLIPGVEVDKYKLGFFKAVYSLIYDLAFKEMGYRRLEIAILSGWEKGIKWAKALGFKHSHTCEAYDEHYRNHEIFYKVVRWQSGQ